MSGLLRGIVRLRTTFLPRGSIVTQRTNLSTKPAKDDLGLMVSVLRVFDPERWVLCPLMLVGPNLQLLYVY